MAQMTIWTIGDFTTQKAETIDTDNEPLVTHSKTRFNIGAKEFVDMMNSELQYYDVPMLTEKKMDRNIIRELKMLCISINMK